MKTKIDKRFMAKKYDNSYMFLLPPTSEYKDCFFFQNKDFVKEQGESYEISNADAFEIKLYRKGENGATTNVSIREVNKAYHTHESLINAPWTVEKTSGDVVLVSTDTDDGEYYILTDASKLDGRVEQGDSVKIREVGGSDFVSNSYAESDFYFTLAHDKAKGEFSEQEEKAYAAYIEEVKERTQANAAEGEWFDYVMPRAEWAEGKIAAAAQYKIKSYVNDKKYEKNIPYALRDRKQFIVWKWAYDEKREKAIKLPMNPNYLGKTAKSDDPYTWATFDKCCEVVNEHGDKFGFAGIGIMFGKGVMGVDFDHCFKDGELREDVKDIVYKLGSYTERSPSGDGLHVLLFGEVPEGYGNRNDAQGVECYDNRRFFTLTGNVLDRQLNKMRKKTETEQPLQELAERFLKPKTAQKTTNATATGERTVGGLALEDEEIIRLIRKGNRGKAFESLFDKGEVPTKANGLLNLQCMKLRNGGATGQGDFSSNDEILRHYEKDHSSCDAYLCGILAGYTDSPEQMDRIFRQSALMRDKWDSRRGNSTYGDMLCNTALNRATWKYKGAQAAHVFSAKKGQITFTDAAFEEMGE